jgi:uncharacterized protein YjiS (DUF1127 family)
MPHVDQPARGMLRTLTSWFLTRSRAASDRDALSRLSERELADIGLGCFGTRCADDRAFIRPLI